MTNGNAKPKELTGNVVVVTVGCEKCPLNEEYKVFSREECDSQIGQIGKVFECPNCKGKWLLKRVQMRGVIIDAEQDSEEWRVSPLFVPIMESFQSKTLNVLDVPVSLIEDKDEEEA